MTAAAVNDVDVVVGVMLLGCMAFQLSLFYLVNHHDSDIKEYSWHTISHTISIFCSVVLFNGMDGLLDYYFVGNSHYVWWRIVWGFLELLIFLLLLQFGMWFSAGLASDDKKREFMLEVDHQTHHQAKSCSLLLAHITAFASIHAWGQVQELFSDSIWMTFMMVPISFGVMMTLFVVTNHYRERENYKDGRKDRWETLWDSEVEVCLKLALVPTCRTGHCLGPVEGMLMGSHLQGSWMRLPQACQALPLPCPLPPCSAVLPQLLPVVARASPLSPLP